MSTNRIYRTGLIVFALWVLGMFFVSLLSCNKVKDGERREEIPLDPPEGWKGQYVFLEEFTGVGCANCPVAAKRAQSLKKIYQDRLIIVELHPAGLSLTGKLRPSDPYLGTASAKTYHDAWQKPDLPNAVINRGSSTVSYGDWKEVIDEVYVREAVAELQVVASFMNELDTSFQVEITGEFVESYATAGDIHLITMIVEDSLVVSQASAGGRIDGYVHNHVLREVIGGNDWGERVTGSLPIKGTTFAKNYTDVPCNEAWKSRHLSIVAFICNFTTKEVIQAGYTHIN